MTSKRQVTFPVSICDELKIRPGESIVIDRREIDDNPVWGLIRSKQEGMPWFGAFRSYATDKSNDMSDIRDSMGRKSQRNQSMA